jgi:23S rRNA pseudouridine1911/1915/1917 synthase
VPNPATGTMALRITSLCYPIGLLFNPAKEHAGKRLDHYLAEMMPQFSRARIQEWIKSERVTVCGAASRSSFILRGGEEIEVTPAEPPPLKAEPEDIPLEVLYADEDLIAVNKSAGMVVHAGAGRHSGTLVNALLHKFQSLSTVSGNERPGIVHRLDRETSGVLLVARTDQAHRALAEQFSGRSVEKTYLALAQGRVALDHGHIRSRIARHPVHRTRMMARLDKGRAAHTEYRVVERLSGFTLLEVDIHTGRTHQIRVHLASIGNPVAGDTLYGAARSGYGRFFLHAWRISFDSPSRGTRITVEAPLAPELQEWLDILRQT